MYQWLSMEGKRISCGYGVGREAGGGDLNDDNLLKRADKCP